MKNIILFIGILLSYQNVYAQESIEWHVYGEIYTYDLIKNKIKNKNNDLIRERIREETKDKIQKECIISIEISDKQKNRIKNEMINNYSEDFLKEIGEKFFIIFITDSLGKPVVVEFKLLQKINIANIKPEEIRKLEQLFLNTIFTLKNTCPWEKYYHFTYPFTIDS